MAKKSFVNEDNNSLSLLINHELNKQGTSQQTVSKNVSLIPLDEIISSNSNPRKQFDNIDELANSIVENQLIQPIAVRQDGRKYVIIVGERRYRAFKQLSKRDDKYSEIPCIILDTESDNDLLSLIENLQRENLNPVDESRFIVEYRTKRNVTQEALGKLIGKSRDFIKHSEEYFKGYNHLIELGGVAQNDISKLAKSHVILFATKDKADILQALDYLKENDFNIPERKLRDFFSQLKMKNEPVTFNSINRIHHDANNEENNEVKDIATIADIASVNEPLQISEHLLVCKVCENSYPLEKFKKDDICINCYNKVNNQIIDYYKSANNIKNVSSEQYKKIMNICKTRIKANVYIENKKLLIFFDSEINTSFNSIIINDKTYKRVK